MSERTCWALGWVLVLATGVASAQEVSSFELKGFRLGGTEAQLRERYPRVDCKDYEERARALGDRRCQFYRSGSLPNDVPGDLTTIAEWEVKSYSFSFIGDRLESLQARLPTAAFERLVAGLVEKYGKPSKVENTPLTTRAGVRYENQKVFWTRGDQVLQVTRFFTDVDTAQIMLQSARAIQLFEERSARGSRDL